MCEETFCCFNCGSVLDDSSEILCSACKDAANGVLGVVTYPNGQPCNVDQRLQELRDICVEIRDLLREQSKNNPFTRSIECSQ